MLKQSPLALSFFLLLALLISCGGGTSGSNSVITPVSTITSVTVSAWTSTTQVLQTVGFTARVSGTGSFDNSVTWSVNETPNGNATIGLINSFGTYTAPAEVPSSATVTIRATSVADPTKSGTATLHIGPLITINGPSPYAVSVGGSHDFYSIVSGVSDTRVIWTVNSIEGGNATVGTILQTGTSGNQNSAVYSAPVMKPSTPIEVRATSIADSSSYAQSLFDVRLKVTISPTTAQVTCGQTQQFTATVQGATDTTVTWTASQGTITDLGLYTAPTIPSYSFYDTVSAVPKADSASSATSYVEMRPLAPVIKGISPQPAASGQEITINGENFYGFGHVVTFHASDGTPIEMEAPSSSSTELKVTVPLGSASGAISTQIKTGTFPTAGRGPMSSAYPFERLPRLRLYAANHELGNGESITLKHALLGGTTNLSIRYTATKGSVDPAGVYTAPSVTADDFTTVTGCFEGTQVCDNVHFALHPFATRPRAPIVAAGQSISMSTEPNTGATWSLSSGGGAMLPGGLYTAGAMLPDGGGTQVTATSSGTTRQASIAVTGLFPGIVNRIEYLVDPEGSEIYADKTQVEGLAISGNLLYVRVSMPRQNQRGWIDYYDITERLEPRWLGAFEAAAKVMYTQGDQLYLLGSTIAQYNLRVDPPALVRHVIPKEAISLPAYSGGVLHAVPSRCWVDLWYSWEYPGLSPTCDEGKIPLFIYDLRQGGVVERRLELPYTSGATAQVFGIAGTDSHLLIVLRPGYEDNVQLATYDLTQNPPVLVNAQSVPYVHDLSLIGNVLMADMFHGSQLFEVSNNVPQALNYIPLMRSVVDVQPGRSLVGAGNSELRLLNTTDAAHPEITAVLFDHSNHGTQGQVLLPLGTPDFQPDRAKLVDDYVYVAGDSGGVTIWDISAPGGAYSKSLQRPGEWAAAWDLTTNGNYLYVASDASYDVYDLTSNPLSRVGSWITDDWPSAVETLGHYLFAGMDNSLTVLDTSAPSPSYVSSTALHIRSLALKGNTLYAGTYRESTVTGQIKVFDVSSPSTPTLLQTITPPTLFSTPVGMQVHGNLLLVAAYDEGLLIYDISQNNAPVLRSHYSVSPAYDVVGEDNFLFVAANYDGLVILDISNPSAPVLVSRTLLSRDPFQTSAPGSACAVTMRDKIAYVGGCDGSSIYGYDYRTRVLPRLVTAFDEFPQSIYGSGSSYDTWVNLMLTVGNDLYVAGAMGEATLAQIDISRSRNVLNLFYPTTTSARPSTFPYSRDLFLRPCIYGAGCGLNMSICEAPCEECRFVQVL